MTTRARGASLNILTSGNIREQTVSIHFESGIRQFVLYDADDVAVACSDHPKPLSQYAWANCCLEVRHDYDLAIPEAQ